MNKKIFIPIFVLVAIIPAIGLLSESNDDTATMISKMIVPHNDKTISFVDFDSRAMDLPEAVDRSTLIIIGTVLDTHSFDKKINLSHEEPWTFTIANVMVDDILKGDNPGKVIQVSMIGGESDERIALVSGSLAKEKERVVMFLELDEDGVFAPHYNLITQAGGMYTIQDNIAENYDESKSMQLDRLVESVSIAIQR